MAAFLVCVLR
jgi:ubiquitin carboxyl-terminal hydrolase L3